MGLSFEQTLSEPWWRISDPGMLIVEDTLRRFVDERALRTAVPLVLSEVDPPYGGVTVSLTDRGVLLYMHPNGHETGTLLVVPDPQCPVPRNRWSCFQLAIEISATQGIAGLSVDGLAAVASPRMSTLPSLGYRGVSAGLVGTGPDQSWVDVYVDELVVDTSPIPCD